MPDLAQMQTLVLVAEHGSLAAAARLLGISSAAISKQMTKLEKELGVQLLIRSTRQIEFTEVGANYCNQCQRILEEVEEAEALISNMKATPKGRLKVVSSRHFSNAYIVPHLKEFLALYPDIEVDLELAERIPDLNAEGVDVLIGMSLSATGDAIQKRIGTTHYSFCASPEYLKKHGSIKKPADLLKHRYITHSMRKPDDELMFSNKQVIKVTPYLRVNDADTMLELAKRGLGVVKLHYYVVQDLLQQGKLIELLTSFVEPEIPLYVAFPRRRYIPAKVRCFIDFITAKSFP